MINRRCRYGDWEGDTHRQPGPFGAELVTLVGVQERPARIDRAQQISLR